MSLIDATLAGLLVCPRCRGDLDEIAADSALRCGACRLRFAVTDGVPNMILKDATEDPVDEDRKG